MKYPRRPIKAHNSWLVRPMANRGQHIAGVMLHSTRSGKVLADEGERTEGWWNNPINKVNDNPPWGSYADVLLFKDGTQVICTDHDTEYAAWTAGYGAESGTWAAGMYYIQIELPQGTLEEEFPAAVIDSVAQITAEYSLRYNFPIVRLPYLTQKGDRPRGITSHDNCANGRAYGKSDPGPLFPWATFLDTAIKYRAGTAVPEPTDLERAVQKLGVALAATEAKVDRLNDAVVLRQKLRRLADDPDFSRVEAAAKILKGGGINL